MECGRRILSFLNTRRKNSERSAFFLENGSMLLEELITSWNGRYSIPIRSFSAEELVRATNNFDFHHLVHRDSYYQIYKGTSGNRPILVKKYGSDFPKKYWSDFRSLAIRDMSVALQMSRHNNVLKLIGCCLEFQFPALVHEYPGTVELLSHGLYGRGGGIGHDGSLSWKSRLKIANEIANAFVYLHTAFSTPIIHRNLKLDHVVIDQYGVAKLSDFALCIAIPPGESQVQVDLVAGTCGYVERQYATTGVLTEKTDVYYFGKVLVQLLTGLRSADLIFRDNFGSSMEMLESYVNKDQLSDIVDARMLGEGGTEQEQQLRAFAALALRCLQEPREDRPEMLDVAKELRRIRSSSTP